MATPQRADVNPMESLARDVATVAASVRDLRSSAALSGLPSSRIRTVIEERNDGTLRVGLTNLATGATAWLTEFF